MRTPRDGLRAQLGARDEMGDTIVVFLVLTPVVFLPVTLLGMTLAYPL